MGLLLRATTRCLPTPSTPTSSFNRPSTNRTALTSLPCFLPMRRTYLKHRAHALTNPKGKGRNGAAGGSPTIQVDARG